MNSLLREAPSEVVSQADVTPAASGSTAGAPAAAPASAIYTGWVRHRRYRPHAHAFTYRLYLLYLDLAELDTLFAGQRWFSVGRRNVAEFRRSDYLGPPELGLADAVRARVLAATGIAPAGPIRLLTHLRYLGHHFNPVSFYYCYAADGITLETIVAEITNTPWKERHAYILPVSAAEVSHGVLSWNFAKVFHVSPFLPMQRDYRWRFSVPQEALRIHMEVLGEAVKDFDATLVLQRRPLTRANLTRCLLRFPLMTLKIVAAIHWQAFIIFLRRNPVYSHPGKD